MERRKFTREFKLEAVRLIKERGVALAHDCGVNRTYLSAAERAERNVSIDNIARIAKGLKIEPGAC